MVSLDIQNSDQSYDWLLEWLSDQPEMACARKLSVETSYTAKDGQPIACLVPSLGYHRLKYKNNYVWINRNRDTTFNMASGRMFESLTISVQSRGNNAQQLLRDIVNEALKKGHKKDEGKTVIFTTSFNDWHKFGARAKRPWKSVILPAGIKEEILNDAINFMQSDVWYRDRGIPYRRGYLLYGCPGSGKSSLIHALAGELNLNICLVSISQANMTDELLITLLNSAPPNALLVLEDVDAAFVARTSTEKSNHVTFSGLLNALDGVAAQEGTSTFLVAYIANLELGRLLFMTTNKIQTLDPALIRDGRVDKKIHLGNATQEQAGYLFAHFYGLDRSAPLVEQFENKIFDGELSMAAIQGHFMVYRNNAAEAVQHIEELTRRKSA
jgi:chaperone BCS1